MQICVIGTGYVGLVAGACLAEAGHVVTCVDNNAAKVAQLANGVVTIHEPGVPSLVSHNLTRGRLFFTADLARFANRAQLYFITVGTPSNGEGSADVSQVLDVAGHLGRLISEDALHVCLIGRGPNSISDAGNCCTRQGQYLQRRSDVVCGRVAACPASAPGIGLAHLANASKRSVGLARITPTEGVPNIAAAVVVPTRGRGMTRVASATPSIWEGCS